MDNKTNKTDINSTAKARSQFISDMGHELRTPLNAVIGLSELLKEDAKDAGDDDYIEPLDRINDAGNLLLRLINNMIDVAKLDAGTMKITIDKSQPNVIAQEVASLTKTMIEKNKNQFKIECAEDAKEIETDASKVKKILINFIDNASKFTKEGTITLSITTETKDNHPWIVFKVTDTGKGMSSDHLQQILNSFEQDSLAIKSETGSYGLGLSVVYRLCRFLNGNLEITSEADKGTVCMLKLPVHFPK